MTMMKEAETRFAKLGRDRKCKKELHGMHGIPEYFVWSEMKTRCLTPTYKHFNDYGGRGIKICERWAKSFRSFMEDMGPRPSDNHSIERINNNGHYEPMNCKWSTDAEQAINKRNNNLITAFGETLCVAEWARRTGINKEVLYSRKKIGWTGERVLSTRDERRRK